MAKKQYIEIEGQQWKDCGQRTVKRVQRADSPPPKERAHAVTPHPTKKGYKVYWIFFGLMFILLVLWGAGLIPCA